MQHHGECTRIQITRLKQSHAWGYFINSFKVISGKDWSRRNDCERCIQDLTLVAGCSYASITTPWHIRPECQPNHTLASVPCGYTRGLACHRCWQNTFRCCCSRRRTAAAAEDEHWKMFDMGLPLSRQLEKLDTGPLHSVYHHCNTHYPLCLNHLGLNSQFAIRTETNSDHQAAQNKLRLPRTTKIDVTATRYEEVSIALHEHTSQSYQASPSIRDHTGTQCYLPPNTGKHAPPQT